MARQQVGSRGEYADSPYDIPRRGWWEVLRRVQKEVSRDNLSLVAAGVAFYGFLAVFPAISAFVILYGIFADPVLVEEQMRPLAGVVPGDAYAILTDQLQQVAESTDATLGIGLILSLLLALWSSTKGVKALMTTMNIAYEENEARGFIRQNVVALLFTLGAILFVIVSLMAIAVIPAAVQLLDPGEPVATILLWIRWAVLAVLIMVALGVLYRFGPNRRQARWRWVSPGAVLAGALWLAGSALFSFYAANFANFNETFGSLGAVVVLLFWFYLSAFVVGVGAEINAELERQTYRDSTIGPVRPIGTRGAYVADHTVENSREFQE